MSRTSEPEHVTPDEQLLREKRDLIEMMFRVSSKLEELRRKRETGRNEQHSD
jgi:hypothetical protein